MAYTVQPIVVGDTVDFTLSAQKDGAAWDITGGAVSLYLGKPDGTVLGPYAATINAPTLGGAHYQTATTVIDTAGVWSRQWLVSVTPVVARSAEIPFTVEPSLA